MALVLVVEDELSIAKLLEDVLSDEGHRVVLAGNGRQALEMASKEVPDVVVTDFMMPVMDGAALVKALVADEVLRHVPVVLMSSLPEDMIADRCAGYAVFVRKPFKIFNIVDVVSRFAGPTGH